MDQATIARAFNAWMDDFINDPAAFASNSEIAHKHLAEKLDGAAPTYGDISAALLKQYAG